MKLVHGCVAAVLGVLLVASGLAFVQGSFELVPSAEQLEKGRLAYGLIFLANAGLLVLVLRAGRRAAGRSARS